MRYFAYGSNMNPQRMRDRGVNFLSREHAFLEGWRLVFNKVSSKPNEGYANIVPDEGHVVEGVLYEIRGSDIEKLDRYEGYPYHYDRIEVNVKLDGGRKVKAVTYVAKHDKTRNGLRPSKEYLYHLLKGCDLLSEEYCEGLRRLETSK